MTFDKIHAAQAALTSKSTRPLGSLLWWTLNGNRIDHDQLVDLARREGLDEKYIPAEVKPTAAFRRAWRHVATKLPKGLLLRPIAETDDVVLIGLVREQANERAQDLEYDVAAKICFHKTTHVVSADVENQVTAEIDRMYRHHQAHTTEDIRLMLTGFLAEAGVSLRESGGVYFVPAAYQNSLDALCAVVQTVGHNATYQLPIADSEATCSTLREVAERTLDAELQQLQADLERYDHATVRPSTLERKLTDFEDLRTRVGLFARVLSFKAEAFTKKIEIIQSNLRQQLDNREPTTNEGTEVRQPPVEFDIGSFAAGVGF
jgi:hypothetical protein